MMDWLLRVNAFTHCAYIGDRSQAAYIFISITVGRPSSLLHRYLTFITRPP